MGAMAVYENGTYMYNGVLVYLYVFLTTLPPIQFTHTMGMTLLKVKINDPKEKLLDYVTAFGNLLLTWRVVTAVSIQINI